MLAANFGRGTIGYRVPGRKVKLFSDLLSSWNRKHKGFGDETRSKMSHKCPRIGKNEWNSVTSAAANAVAPLQIVQMSIAYSVPYCISCTRKLLDDRMIVNKLEMFAGGPRV